MKVRIGIVGCGAIAPTHGEAIGLIEQAELAGFFDLFPEKARAASERFGAPAFDSFEELLEACDAISVCVPSGLHAEVGIEAARAGKHLIVEKPIEVSWGAAKGLVEACKVSGVKLAVVSQHRFSDGIQRLKSAIEEGALGPLIAGDAYIKWYRTQAYYDSGGWRGTRELDGGCLLNQGIHYIDMIQWLMGGAEAVQAQVRTAAHRIEVEDLAAALVEYKNGALGVIQGSTSSYPGFAERLEVHGRHGSVVIEGDKVRVWELDEERGESESPYGRGVRMQPTPNLSLADAESPSDAMSPHERWIELHRRQIEDFVMAVRDDREPFLTGEMALAPLGLILAIYESSSLGGARVQVARS